MRSRVVVAAFKLSRSQSVDSAQNTQPRKFRPDIEGLRAVAVLMVVLDHAGLSVLSGGYVGVDVFFVISGFLITSALLKEHDRHGRISLPQFYARRIRRLLPAGTLVLLSTLVGSYLYLGESRANRVAYDALWSSLFFSNFRFIRQGTDYLDAQLPPSPLQHFWSLAVEEQFYAVWPALIVVIALVATRIPLRFKLTAVLIAIIVGSLVWSMHQTTTNATAAYFSPFPRACELALGALLAVGVGFISRIPRLIGPVASWSGAATILATAFMFNETTRFPGLAVIIPTAGAALVIAGGTISPGAGAETVLRHQLLQWIGGISYSLYLWHWPLLVIAAGRAGHELSLWQNLLIVLIATVLSAATLKVVENPVRNWKLLKAKSPLVSLAIGAALVAISLGTANQLINSHQSNQEGKAIAATTSDFRSTDEVLDAVAVAVNAKEWPPQPTRINNLAYSKKCNVTRKDTSSPDCTFGDTNGMKRVVVYGDSHANMWIPALDVIGKQAHWQVIQMTKPGCQVSDFPSYSDTLKREYTECAEYRTFALTKIEQLRPDLVLISSAFKGVKLAVDGKPSSDGTEQAWETGLASMIERLKPLGGRIVVLGDMAYPDEPGIDCLTDHSDDVVACNTPRKDGVLEDHNAAEKQTTIQSGAIYVDTIPWFCTKSVCPSVIDGLTVHRDAYHVAENYAVWLAGALGGATGLIPLAPQSASA